jgi:hypothetical protein
MVALIMAFLGLETQLFWTGVRAPETASQPVELTQPAVAAEIAPAAAQPAAASPQAAMPAAIELVYDASSSMLVPIKGAGMHRWDVTKSGLQEWLNSGAITLDASFGMQSYGQGDSACGVGSAIALAPYSFERAYNGIADTYPAAGGTASIAASLRAVTADLGSAQGPATIVLVASSAEGCGGDPAAEAAAFAASQPNRQVHVLGVAIEDPAVTAQLRSIAEQGNGQYVAVSNSEELAVALQQVVGSK